MTARAAARRTAAAAARSLPAAGAERRCSRRERRRSRRERRRSRRVERRRRRRAREGRTGRRQVEGAPARGAEDGVQILAGHLRAGARRVGEALDRRVHVAGEAAVLAAVLVVVDLLQVAGRQLLQLPPQPAERRLDLHPLQDEADGDHGEGHQSQRHPGEVPPLEIVGADVGEQRPEVGLGRLHAEERVVGLLLARLTGERGGDGEQLVLPDGQRQRGRALELRDLRDVLGDQLGERVQLAGGARAGDHLAPQKQRDVDVEVLLEALDQAGPGLGARHRSRRRSDPCPSRAPARRRPVRAGRPRPRRRRRGSPGARRPPPRRRRCSRRTPSRCRRPRGR